MNSVQPGSKADADAATAQSAAALKVGSIWRERDNRFERLVRVVSGPSGNMSDPRVGIQTITFNRKKPKVLRTTYARVSAFGKRYMFEAAGAPSASTTDDSRAPGMNPNTTETT